MTNETQERIVFRVALATSYLTENWRSEDGSLNECAQIQVKQHGYDPQNLYGIREIKTKEAIIKLLPLSEYSDGERSKLARLSDLVIAGQTRDQEKLVYSLKKSGVLVARYSKFYGGWSEYNLNSPEEVGYSLDIPKKVDAVKELITCSPFIRFVLKRNGTSIRQTLHTFLNYPVLSTSFLEEALSHPNPRKSLDVKALNWLR